MTSRESLFNKSIFKTTIRRFRLGSLLYFILLFLSVPVAFLTTGALRLEQRFLGSASPAFSPERSVLLNTGYLVFPMLIAFVVPTVVALLVYNYVHSPRHAIFVHSAPVKRRANFISSGIAALVLMWVPIILNAIILMVMGLTAYKNVIGFTPVLIWMLINLFITFVMFSIASFSSFLTGNGFALIFINAIILFLPVLVALAVQVFFTTFLHGYLSNSFITENIMKISPPVWITEKLNTSIHTYAFFENIGFLYFLIGAIVFYLLGLLVCKKRKVELCGEVAAFKVMRPIIKYTICAIVFVLSFGIFYEGLGMSMPLFSVVGALLCLIFYFGLEMLIQKNMRVWNKWKGLVGFYIATAIILSFLAFTNVFGFETRVPDIANVKDVSIYTYYHTREPVSSNPKVIETAVNSHKLLIKHAPILTPKDDGLEQGVSYDILTIKYTLKNGKKMGRHYRVPKDQYLSIMNSLFKHPDYKEKVTEIDVINRDKVKNLNIDIFCGSIDFNEILTSDAPLLMDALYKDIQNITYDEYAVNSRINFEIRFESDREQNKKTGIFKEEAFRNGEIYDHASFNHSFDMNYKNAIDVLEKAGVYDRVKEKFVNKMYVTKQTYLPNSNEKGGFILNPSSLIPVEYTDAEALFELALKTDTKNPVDGECYFVYCTDNPDNTYSDSAFLRFTPQEFPEFLKKYID